MSVAVPPPRAARPGRIVAVASGKGGVGKTWLAITIAHAAARGGARVLLFDGDLGLANVDIQLGLVPRSDLGHVLSGQCALDAAVTAHEGGFDILPGRSGSGALASLDAPRLEAVLGALREAARRYDLVVLDLGAGLDPAIRRMSVFADTLLVVATDEPTSLTDAYAVVKLHAADTGAVGGAAGGGASDVRVAVNQAASRTAGERTFATLARACATFLGRAPVLAGVVRRDDKVRDAIRRQTLLLTRHPNAAAAADVEEITRGLL